MSEHFVVNVNGLNFRSSPVVDPDNIRAVLANGQVVIKIEIVSDQWWKVSAELNGQELTGFVAKRFLDPAQLEFRVIADSLNLRSAPVRDPSNLITPLPRDQIVSKLSSADQDWWKVSTTVSGAQFEGYVNSRFLAPLDDPFEGKKVVGMDNTTQSFRQKVVQIANRIQAKPIFLMAVMSFETGGTFSPSIRNPASGATGLIQFIGPTAEVWEHP